MKFYAVLKGRKTGIFNTWSECEKQVKGYKNSKYKSFKSKSEALKYMMDEEDIVDDTSSNLKIFNRKNLDNSKKNYLSAYTDGSCCDKIGGYGCVLLEENDVVELCGRVPIKECTNQKAELYAILKVVDHYNYNNENEELTIDIYTDSMYSINCLTKWYKTWIKNGWKTSNNKNVVNKQLIQDCLKLLDKFSVNFIHVKAHSGIKYNEHADELANIGRYMKFTDLI